MRAYPVRRVAMVASALVVLAACNADGEVPPRARPSSPSVAPRTSPELSPSVEPPVLGPVLDPGHLPVLPDQGLAVEMEAGVVLVGQDGRVFGHLPGFKVDELVSVPGPVLLHGPASTSFVLWPGRRRLESERGVRIPLAGGAVLAGSAEGKAEPRTWSIERDGRVLVRITNEAWSLSQDRDLVTLQRFRPKGGTFVATSSRAFDVEARTFAPVPSECAAMARRGQDLFLLCDRKPESSNGLDDVPSIEVLRGQGASPERITGGPPVPSGAGAGFWRQAYLSPDGGTVLAQWSTECEVQESFVVPSSGGEPQPVARIIGGDSAESLALGWTPDGRALVFLPFAACGSGAESPGVYALDKHGNLSLIYRTSEFASVKLWQ